MRLRKILALVLSFAMTFSLLTVTGAGETVEARGEESLKANTLEYHCLYGCTDQCEHEHFSWTEYTGESLNNSGDMKYVYLTADLNVGSVRQTFKNVSICLNGHNITVTPEEGHYSRIATLNGTVNLTEFQDGTGAVHGGTGGTGGTGAGSGGAFYVSGSAVFNMYGGTITGNSGTNGGAIYIDAGCTLNMYGGTITGNSGTNGGAIYAAAGSTLNITGGEIVNNISDNEGGAIYCQGAAAGKVTALLKDVSITGNTAKNGSAIAGYGTDMVIDGAVITGNNATGGYGAVHLTNSSSAGLPSLTIKGSTRICDNTSKESVAQNVYLREYDYYIDVENLADDARIGVTMDDKRWNNEDQSIRYITSTDSDAFGYDDRFFSDNGRRVVVPDGTRLLLCDHENHCLCGTGSEQGCDHTALTWTAWTDTDSLPTKSGNYFLTKSVELAKVYTVPQNTRINICLNGHNIASSEGSSHRMILLSEGATLSITDCRDVSGKICGGRSTFGAGIRISQKAIFNLYNGIITDNVSEGSEGGAVYVLGRTESKDGGSFRMYGGRITGNTAGTGSAISIYGASGDSIVDYTTTPGNARFFGGYIGENTATASGTINARKLSTLSISDCEICNNVVSNNGGAIRVCSGSDFLIQDSVLSGNSAGGKGGGIWADAETNLNIYRTEIVNNNASEGSGIYQTSSSANVVSLIDVTISDNQVTSSDGGAVCFGIGKLILGGKCSINDNYNSAGEKNVDILMNSGKTLEVDTNNHLQEDSKVSLFFAARPSDGTPVVTNAAGISSSCFTLTNQNDVFLKQGTDDDEDKLVTTTYLTYDGKVYEPYTGSDVPTENPTSAETDGYYLKKDVTLGAQRTLSGDLNLFLNGKTVTLTNNKWGLVIGRDKNYSLCVSDYPDSEGGFTTSETRNNAPVFGSYNANDTVGNSKGSIELRDINIFNISASSQASVASIQGDTALTMINCRVYGNTSSKGAGIYLATSGNVLFDSCSFTGNKANGGSVIYKTAAATGTLTMKDCKVTGNTDGNSSAPSGALRLNGTGNVFEGTNIFAGNVNSSSTKAPANIFLEKEETRLTVKDPTDGTLLQINSGSISSGQIGSYELTGENAFAGTYIWTSADGKQIRAENEMLVLDELAAQDLVLSGEHAGTYKPWVSASSLPTNDPAGYDGYYLVRDVISSSVTNITGDLHLFLNGKQIYAASASAWVIRIPNGDGHALTVFDEGITQGGFIAAAGVSRGGSMIGSLAASAGTITLDGVCFRDLSGTSTGIVASIQGSTQATFRNCTFSGVTTTGEAPVYVASSNEAVFDGCRFENCTSGSYGGAIEVTLGGSVKIKDCEFDSCSIDGTSGSVIAVKGSSADASYREGTIAFKGTNSFANLPDDKPAIFAGRRSVCTIKGEFTIPDRDSQKAFISGAERSLIVLDHAEVRAVDANNRAITTLGTLVLDNSSVQGKTLIDASYNMWQIQMDAMAVAKGESSADITLTQNDGSWFSQQEGGFPERAILAIQGENLSGEAAISLHIPEGGDIDSFVFGPSTINPSKNGYIVTPGAAAPGFGPAVTDETSGKTYDVSSVQLTIGESYSLTYYVDTDDADAGVRFYLDGSDTPVPNDRVSFKGGKCTLIGMSPKDMTTEIKIVLTDGEGNEKYSADGFSIAAYADALYENYKREKSTAAKALIHLLADMLRFGDESQKYTETEAPLPTSGRNWVKNYVSANVRPSDSVEVLNNGGDAQVRAANLEFREKTSITFKASAGASVSPKLQFKNAGETEWADVEEFSGTFDELCNLANVPFSVKATGTGQYRIATAPMTPLEYGRQYRLILGSSAAADPTVVYSVNTYINRMWDDEDIGALVRAMFDYEMSAKAYVSALGGN
ncbi:MAG: hypothetical protein IJS22_09075 [Lachnospiraceae bacterium]|nr:hypothetical protein [Lachnospiraceae bacterium]